jgi:hypothetical protein
MSNVSVQTWLTHSVDVLLTVTHAAPNTPFMGASGLGGELPEQAQTKNEQARRNRRMTRRITGPWCVAETYLVSHL